MTNNINKIIKIQYSNLDELYNKVSKINPKVLDFLKTNINFWEESLPTDISYNIKVEKTDNSLKVLSKFDSVTCTSNKCDYQSPIAKLTITPKIITGSVSECQVFVDKNSDKLQVSLGNITFEMTKEYKTLKVGDNNYDISYNLESKCCYLTFNGVKTLIKDESVKPLKVKVSNFKIYTSSKTQEIVINFDKIDICITPNNDVYFRKHDVLIDDDIIYTIKNFNEVVIVKVNDPYYIRNIKSDPTLSASVDFQIYVYKYDDTHYAIDDNNCLYKYGERTLVYSGHIYKNNDYCIIHNKTLAYKDLDDDVDTVITSC